MNYYVNEKVMKNVEKIKTQVLRNLSDTCNFSSQSAFVQKL